MKGRVVGIVACAKLDLYKRFLEQNGYTVRPFLSIPPATDCSVLLFCDDHLADPALIAEGSKFSGLKIIIGGTAGRVPKQWQNSRFLPLPLLPIDLEKALMEPVATDSTRLRILIIED